MKIKEIRFPQGRGFGGIGKKESRVVVIKDDEPMPPDAEKVPEDTKVYDWKEVNE